MLFEQEDPRWKLKIPYFYREKSFSIHKLLGNQSLKSIPVQSFQRLRKISVDHGKGMHLLPKSKPK